MINQLQEKYQLSLLLLLGSLAVLGVLPFVFIRYLEGNVVAMTIDVALILGIISLLIYAYYSSNFRIVGLIAAFFINAGVVVMVVANGVDGFMWVYPVFASAYILVKPFEAFWINMAAAVALVLLADIFHVISF